MDPLWLALLFSILAGITIPIGGFVARNDAFQPLWTEEELRHSIIAFGAGLLLAAVMLVLIPQGLDRVAAWEQPVWLLVGGLFFAVVDVFLSQGHGSRSQLIAMLADFVPESIAMGALFAIEPRYAMFLAVLIAVQNLPEAFNSMREMLATDPDSDRKFFWMFVAMVPVGPICALLGLYVFADSPTLIGGVMLFASGGILYLMFQDIAPQVVLENRWGPPFGALLGFAFAIVGHAIVH